MKYNIESDAESLVKRGVAYALSHGEVDHAELLAHVWQFIYTQSNYTLALRDFLRFGQMTVLVSTELHQLETADVISSRHIPIFGQQGRVVYSAKTDLHRLVLADVGGSIFPD